MCAKSCLVIQSRSSILKLLTQVEATQAKQLTLEAPALDLIPPKIYTSMFKRSIQDAGLPLVWIPRVNAEPLSGILVYAESCEP